MAGVLLWRKIIIQDYERVEEAYNQALRGLTDELREMYRAYYRRYKGFDPSNLKEKIPNGTLKQFQKAVAELGLDSQKAIKVASPELNICMRKHG